MLSLTFFICRRELKYLTLYIYCEDDKDIFISLMSKFVFPPVPHMCYDPGEEVGKTAPWEGGSERNSHQGK